MVWSAYNLRWRLLSPMHIGFRKAGNLQMTRGYVPGWALWGAFTARMCRDRDGKDYAGMGEIVRKQMAFTHFYFERRAGDVKPWGTDEAEFQWQFFRGYTSTALANGYNQEDGSLHETEFIAPYARCGEAVFLAGTVLIADDEATAGWRRAAERISLGGERSYGWGRVEVSENGIQSLGASGGWLLNKERPQKVFEPGVPIGGHVHRRGANGREILLRGESEVVVRRLTDTKAGQFGMVFSDPSFCWRPGSEAVNNRVTLSLGSDGIWMS